MIDDKFIGLYAITDDILKAIGHPENRQRRLSDTEVLTTAFVAALFFKECLLKSSAFVFAFTLEQALL